MVLLLIHSALTRSLPHFSLAVFVSVCGHLFNRLLQARLRLATARRLRSPFHPGARGHCSKDSLISLLPQLIPSSSSVTGHSPFLSWVTRPGLDRREVIPIGLSGGARTGESAGRVAANACASMLVSNMLKMRFLRLGALLLLLLLLPAATVSSRASQVTAAALDSRSQRRSAPQQSEPVDPGDYELGALCPSNMQVLLFAGGRATGRGGS